MEKQLVIYCADCRGKFEVEIADIIEDDILECSLCGAEMVVVQEDPVKLRLVEPDDEFL